MNDQKRREAIQNALDRQLKRDRRAKWYAIAALILVAVAYFAFVTVFSEPHTHEDYVLAQVEFTNGGIESDSGFKLGVIARLPDDTHVSVSTTSRTLAGSVTDTVCLDRRRSESGRVSYRIAAPQNCSKD